MRFWNTKAIIALFGFSVVLCAEFPFVPSASGKEEATQSPVKDALAKIEATGDVLNDKEKAQKRSLALAHAHKSELKPAHPAASQTTEKVALATLPPSELSSSKSQGLPIRDTATYVKAHLLNASNSSLQALAGNTSHQTKASSNHKALAEESKAISSSNNAHSHLDTHKVAKATLDNSHAGHAQIAKATVSHATVGQANVGYANVGHASSALKGHESVALSLESSLHKSQQHSKAKSLAASSTLNPYSEKAVADRMSVYSQYPLVVNQGVNELPYVLPWSNLDIAQDFRLNFKETGSQMLSSIANIVVPKARADDYVLDNFGKLAFYHSLRPIIEYGAHELSNRLELTGEKKVVFDNYLQEVLRREIFVREVTDELYAYKSRLGDSDINVLAGKIALAKIRAAISDGYAKASDKDRTAYLKLMTNNMLKINSKTCAMYFASVLPKYRDADRVHGSARQLKELVNKMSLQDLKSYVKLNLTFLDYHCDRSRKVKNYQVSPESATAAINSYLAHHPGKHHLSLFTKNATALRKSNDHDVCVNAASYYELITNMHNKEGAQLRLNTFPN